MSCSSPRPLSFIRISLLTLLAAAAPGCTDSSQETSDDPNGSTGDDPSDSTAIEPSASTDAASTDDPGADDTSSDDTTTDDTSVAPGCGNGIVETDEECDTDDLGGSTCQDFGFDGGALACDAACAYDSSGCADLPAAPLLSLSLSPIKQLDFAWGAVAGAEWYQLLESPASGDPFTPVGEELTAESVSLAVPLYLRFEARYALRACNAAGCADSNVVSVAGSFVEAIGYVKASNTGGGDAFGWSVAVSDDGNTLAIGAHQEDSADSGIGGSGYIDGVNDSGAVYVLVRDASTNRWSQQAYVKASNPDEGDRFGFEVALSGDGNTLAVGAVDEDGSATGIGGDQASNVAPDSGAVYVFVRNAAGTWAQQAYVKASNTGASDWFGRDLALSDDGNTLAVGAHGEDSSASGIGGNQGDGPLFAAGAVYVFVRDAADQWSQQAYVKASNPGMLDYFGWSVALSADGDTLAVGAMGEASHATGIGGNQADDSLLEAGAVYVFVRDAADQWSQQAYVKASNPDVGDRFGFEVALSADGDTLAVGARHESSSATGVGGDQADEDAYGSGAVYVFVRSGVATWSQQAYVKASNTDERDDFGVSLALSGDGNTLAVTALAEDGGSNGLQGELSDDSMPEAGAVYVLVRDEAGAWSHRAYVKAPNPDANDGFGRALALSGDGRTLAVTAPWEDSGDMGIGGDQADDSFPDAGAVYLY